MTQPAAVSVFAPAKINLTLHITGQRHDGYHLIDSLVSFATVGDTLSVIADGKGDFSVSGPFADGVPIGADNLIFDATAMFWDGAPLSFHLEKELPVSSGIGGGSADAAACLRAISYFNTLRTSPEDAAFSAPENVAKLTSIGADVPMCLLSKPARVQGVGEKLTPLPFLSSLHAVLVNPGVAVSTAKIFNTLLRKDNAPMSRSPAEGVGASDLMDWVAMQRNDLQPAACQHASIISTVLDAIDHTTGCRVARMSGSGATCFGLYETAEDAAAAEQTLRQGYPLWWVCETALGSDARSAPQLIRSTT